MPPPARARPGAVLMVHGGAGAVPADSLEARLAGCRRAVSAGWALLRTGGCALDAVQAAVEILEDDPLFNAGTGAVLNSDGRVELDAAIMDGPTLRAGAVAAVDGVRNPIALARRVLEHGRHVLLVGDGARRFATAQGFAHWPGERLIVDTQRKRWRERHGTVGAVARDANGGLAAATSTGGVFDKAPGRVGDSPLVGCGTYADEAAAVSCTGDGEAIIRTVLARSVAERLARDIDAPAAASAALAHLAQATGGKAGLIVLGARGGPASACNTAHMPAAWIDRDGELRAGFSC